MYFWVKAITDIYIIEGQSWSILRFFLWVGPQESKNINFYRQILFHLQLEKLFLSSYLGRETQSNLTFLSLTTILYKRDQTLSPKVLGTSMTFYNQLWVSHRIALNLNGLSNLQLSLGHFCKSSSSATSEYSTC